MNHGLVNDVLWVLRVADAPMSARQITPLVKRPRYWSYEKTYRNVASLLVEYAKRGRIEKVARGMYSTKEVMPMPTEFGPPNMQAAE